MPPRAHHCAMSFRCSRRVVLSSLWAAATLAGALTGATAAQRLAWFDGTRPTAQAAQAIALLADAGSHGLEPRDYGADVLAQALQALGPASDADAVARLDAALGAAVQRYAADLHRGRVDPRVIHPGFALPPRPAFDAASWLTAALVANRLPAAARELEPALPQYERLRQALAQQRRLVGHAAWQQPLPALPGTRGSRIGKLEPGQAYAGLATLSQRLAAMGDLAEPPGAPAAVYDGPLVEAVRQFQTRHGLGADGVIGAATFAQLQLDPSIGVRRIELALERLRWTPLLSSRRMIVINLPEFVLRAYEVKDDRIELGATMKVIVGKALNTRTPLIAADLRFIEFSPYWNVPPSIARGEVVPRLRRDPGYFTREGFEFVGAGGAVQTTLSAASIDALQAGRVRIRQRPGPMNALGDIKFVFPNQDDIYLHHTPAVSLFQRDRRDFSHGCIRVEDPVGLARFVLRDQPEWTEARIRAAMEKRASATLRLDEPVHVLIAYGTALVKDGRTWFFDDLYGQDRLLDAALQRHARQLQPILVPSATAS